jgi:hypothetical protein
MHLAGRIAERVGFERGGREWRWVRLAGLLHDVGHMPFSHAGEAAVAVLTPGMADLGEAAHERVTSGLIEHDGGIAGALSSTDREAVLDLIEKGRCHRRPRPPEPILWQMISGPLDADKLDYLLRDSLMAGVRYGVFDLDRMVDSFVPHGRPPDRHLAVRHADLLCVEQAVLARYYMTQQVYRHQVRRITDAMLKHAIMSAAKLSGNEARLVRRLFSTCLPNAETWRDAFLDATDGSLLAQLTKMPRNTQCGMLARGLRDRHLLKQVFGDTMADIPEAGVTWREGLVNNISKQGALARRLAKLLEMDQKLVLVDIRQRGNPLYRDPGAPLEEEIRVIYDSGRDERLGDVPESLSQKVKAGEEAELYVYAPAEGATRSERKRMKTRIKNELARAAREGRP